MKKSKRNIEGKRSASYKLKVSLIKQLRHLSIDLERSQGELLEEGIKYLIEKYKEKSK